MALRCFCDATLVNKLITLVWQVVYDGGTDFSFLGGLPLDDDDDGDDLCCLVFSDGVASLASRGPLPSRFPVPVFAFADGSNVHTGSLQLLAGADCVMCVCDVRV